MTVADASLKSTLRGLLRRWDEADRAVRATTPANGAEAEEARLQAEGAIWALEHDVSDLLFMLLRAALSHDPGRLRLYLMDLLGPDVADMIRGFLQGRRSG
jgi:hypothetical protein